MCERKRFELYEEHERVGTHDTFTGIMKQFTRKADFAMVNDVPNALEIWDCLRPNHPKLITHFYHHGIE